MGLKDKEKVEVFLTELKALCLKHNLCVHGCGCCGSPFLIEGPDNEEEADKYLNHLRRENNGEVICVERFEELEQKETK